MNIKVYKINQYEAYRMDEQGIRFSINKPLEDSIHYKSEVESFEVEIPEGFSIIKDAVGNKYLQYGEYSVIIGEDRKGVYFEICDCGYRPRRVYVNINTIN